MGEKPLVPNGSSSPGSTNKNVRFGSFDVDLRAGELRKGGVKIKLQGQPLEVLALLLEQPGQVVTREELQQKLWAGDTFVDFEHGLNKAISRVREALSDQADNPRFIETLPRRGYRFIAPVVGRETIANDKEQASALQADNPPPSATRRKPRIRRQVLRYSILLAGTVLLAAAAFKTVMRPAGVPKIQRFTQLTNDGQEKSGALTTDGSRIFFNETLTDQRPAIVQVPVTGGDAAPLSVALKRPRMLDLSRDGTELLIANDDDFETSSLWVQPVVGGSPRRVGTANITDADFAADGKSIIYGSEHDVYSVSRDGSSVRKLLTADGVPFGFRFSPDGRTFRFTALDYRADSMTIMEASADGTGLHKMFGACCGGWTPDGRFFIFQNRIHSRLDLWALSEARPFPWRKREDKPVQLTAGPLNFESPLLSADGKKIFAIGGSSRAEVIRYDSSSGQFVHYFSGISAEGLTFSKDGQWVAYTSYPDGALWRSKMNGSERLQLTFPPLKVLLPRWSPDGKQIAFSAIRMDGERAWKAYIVSSEGGNPQPLLASEQIQLDVSWSLDGNSLVFGSPGSENKEPIQIIDLRSNRVSPLPGSDGLYSPRWSPDGRYIAAIAKKHPFKLMLFEFSTRKWTELFGSEMGYPSWSHDGKYIYFQNWHDPIGERIVRLRLSDRRVENLVDIKDVGRLTTGTVVPWLGLAPDDSPLFARDISTSEIFALDVEWP